MRTPFNLDLRHSKAKKTSANGSSGVRRCADHAKYSLTGSQTPCGVPLRNLIGLYCRKAVVRSAIHSADPRLSLWIGFFSRTARLLKPHTSTKRVAGPAAR